MKQTGIGAALNALPIEAGPEAEPEQLGLLPLSPAKDSAGAPIQSPTKHGRPPGARSKRTDAWVDYLLSRYRSPLVGLAEVYSRPLKELAAELNCTLHEAMQMQLVAMKELAPYLHQKLPQALQIQADKAIPLVLAIMPPGDHDFANVEQDQDLIPLLPSHVARGELHVDEKAEPEQPHNAAPPLTEGEGAAPGEAKP